MWKYVVQKMNSDSEKSDNNEGNDEIEAEVAPKEPTSYTLLDLL